MEDEGSATPGDFKENTSTKDIGSFIAAGPIEEIFTKDESSAILGDTEGASTEGLVMTPAPPAAATPAAAAGSNIIEASKESRPAANSDVNNAVDPPYHRRGRRVVERLGLPFLPQHRRGPAPKKVSFKDKVEMLPGPSSPFPMIDIVPGTTSKVPLPSVYLEAEVDSIAHKLRMEALSVEKSPVKLQKLGRGLRFFDHLKMSSTYFEQQQQEANVDHVEEVDQEEQQQQEANDDQIEGVDQEEQQQEANEDQVEVDEEEENDEP